MENANEARKCTQSNELRRRGFDGNTESAEISSSKSKPFTDDCNTSSTQLEHLSEWQTLTTFSDSLNTSCMPKENTTKSKSNKTSTPMLGKRSLSESSAEEASRTDKVSIRNGNSLSAQSIWQNELSMNRDSDKAQPNMQRCQQRLSNGHDEYNDNKNGHHKNNHYISDMIDVGIRIAIVLIFIKLETTTAFQRNIHIEELWLYKNPRKADIVTPFVLISSVIFCPLVISILHFLLTNDRRDFRAANWAWTLSLCLNAVTTSLIKISTGRPRPDFFYRCFPDGQMIANVTPTAVNLNCTGEWRVINEGYKSFPSGHASFAFCSFGFIAFYLAGKLHAFNAVGRGESWRMFTAFAPLWLAMLIGISRTCDYHHHWQDVVAGSLIGLAVAYVTYRQYFPSIFSRHSHRALPRDGRLSICGSGSCCKNDYLRRRHNSNADEIDCEISNFAANVRFDASDDHLPLICDDEIEQKQRSQ